MNVNPLASAVNLISSAQYKAADAAQTIARLPVSNQDVGQTESFESIDLFKPVMSLKQSEQETSAAVKVIGAYDTMIGSLLDIEA